MSESIVRSFGVLLLLITPWSGVAASTEEVDGPSISLGEALALTIEHNPELVAFGYQLEAQQGRAVQSKFGPDPELGILVENVLGSGEFNGAESSETTLSLSWVFERGKAERRIDASRAGISMLEAEADIRRLDAAAETARRFIHCLENQEKLIQMAAAVRLAEQTVNAVRQRVTAGRTPEAELARARAQLARFQLEQEDVEHGLRVSFRRLAAQWGNTQAEFSRVEGSSETLPVPDDFTSLLGRVDSNPSVTRYLTAHRLREAELRLAEAEANPSWRIDTGARWFEETNDYAWIAGITIPIKTRSRNQGRISEARARLAQVEADGIATRVQIETQLYEFYEELNHSLHQTSTLRDEILPRMEQALADAERAYAAGRYGYLELSIMQAEVLNTRSALIEASIDAHRNVIEIERLTGVTLSSASRNSEEYR